MNNSFLSILIGLFVILGVGGMVYYQNSDDSQPEATTEVGTNTGASNSWSEDEWEDEDDDDRAAPTSPTTGTGSTNTTASGYTVAEVAQHSSRSSCWSIINGNVYDLTSWIPKHPGGEGAILGICGKDGSSKFNGQHGGGASQAQILVGFKIGAVK